MSDEIWGPFLRLSQDADTSDSPGLESRNIADVWNGTSGAQFAYTGAHTGTREHAESEHVDSPHTFQVPNVSSLHGTYPLPREECLPVAPSCHPEKSPISVPRQGAGTSASCYSKRSQSILDAFIRERRNCFCDDCEPPFAFAFACHCCRYFKCCRSSCCCYWCC
jgi:hypothetical protein